MEDREYEVMYRLESSHWWYRGLHDLVESEARAALRNVTAPRILDAGCGTGRMLEVLQEFSPVGFDASGEAMRFLRERKLPRVLQASLGALPFADSSFDLVLSLDVLYYIRREAETDTLRDICRILRPGGTLILNLPAFDFLKSEHDRAVHISRRYTAPFVAAALSDAGLTPVRTGYRNAFLFPVAAAARLLRKRFADPEQPARSDVRQTPRPINALLSILLRLENRLWRRHWTFPFGLSVFAVARRSAS